MAENPISETTRDPPGKRRPSLGIAAAGPEAVGEAAWIEVIEKMDEVYANLLEYQVALEEKNSALEEAQQFLSGVLNSTSDVLVVCDRHGTVVEVNRAFEDLVGRRQEELRGAPMNDLFFDEMSRRKAAAAELSGRLHDASVQDCEAHLRHRDGSGVSVAFNCSPRHDARGNYAGVVMIGRPLGELRKAYEALSVAHEELKRTQQQLVHSEKMASLGRLVAGVAHELNNPISFVLGNVFALQRYAKRLREYLDAVHAGGGAAGSAALRERLRIDRILSDLVPLIDGTIEGAERTRDIVDALKRFSAVDRESREAFDLGEVAEQAVRWVTRGAATEVAVEIDLPGPLPSRGTAGQVQQVLMNLVQNALDAIGERSQGRIRIEGRDLGDRVEVSVQDNGPGIPEDDLGRVFDPFFSTKPVGKGTGLGLSISYGIVERHGGRLEAGNRESGGAEFRLTLPRDGGTGG